MQKDFETISSLFTDIKEELFKVASLYSFEPPRCFIYSNQLALARRGDSVSGIKETDRKEEPHIAVPFFYIMPGSHPCLRSICRVLRKRLYSLSSPYLRIGKPFLIHYLHHHFFDDLIIPYISSLKSPDRAT